MLKKWYEIEKCGRLLDDYYYYHQCIRVKIGTFDMQQILLSVALSRSKICCDYTKFAVHPRPLLINRKRAKVKMGQISIDNVEKGSFGEISPEAIFSKIPERFE